VNCNVFIYPILIIGFHYETKLWKNIRGCQCLNVKLRGGLRLFNNETPT
jgi:hypothetical protein